MPWSFFLSGQRLLNIFICFFREVASQFQANLAGIEKNLESLHNRMEALQPKQWSGPEASVINQWYNHTNMYIAFIPITKYNII